MLRRHTFSSFSLVLPKDWRNCTDTSPGSREPFTLAKPNGVGALQFTVGIYRGGVIPDPSSHDLFEMLLTFARPHAKGPEFNISLALAPVRLAAASFQLEHGDFMRAWFVSDGLSFAQVTYICANTDAKDELIECEAIVRSIQFQGGAA